MAALAIEEKNLLLERIIMTIKRYGEIVSDGYKIDFAVFTEQLLKDEMVSSSQKLSAIQVTESNIFGFFKSREKVRVQLIAEGKKHSLYLKPRGAVSSKDINEEAKAIINELLKGQKGLSYKKVYEELSRRIVFLEYHLRRKKESVKEYIQQLLPPFLPQTIIDEKTDTETENKRNEPELTAEEAVNKVRKEILSVLEWQGVVSGSYRQMVLGVLCNALADSSEAYQKARGSYHGPARSFLLDRFGDLLTIEYIDGKDWARVPLAAFGNKKGKPIVELPKGKTVPEIKPVPVVEKSPAKEPSVPKEVSLSCAKEIKATKTTKTATEKKETATELLIHELSDLRDVDLEQLQLVVRLVYETAGKAAVKTNKKKIEYVANKDETSAVVEIAAKVGLNAQVVLSKNETMNKIISHLTNGEIVEIINHEIKLRKDVSGDQAGTETDKKAKDKVKVSPNYNPETMTDVDFEGLDDWLPF